MVSNQAGINITSSKLQLVEMSWNFDEIVLENADEECLPVFLDKGISEQELISVIQQAYNQIAMRRRITAQSVSFTLPARLFEIIELPIDDLLTKEDLAAHLNWEFSILFPHKDPSDFLLRYFELGVFDSPNTKKILTAAIEKKILSSVHKFCLSNNLSLRLVDNAHFAANLLIRTEASLQNYVSLYSDDNYYTMMIFERGKPKFFKSFIDQNPDSIANNIKNEYQRFYSSTKEFSGMKSVYAAGESFTDSAISQFERYLGTEIQKITPFGTLKTTLNLTKKELVVSKFHAYAAPIGIAARIS